LDRHPLSEDYPLGETLQDVYEGKYVLLDAQHVEWYLENKDATIDEVWAMKRNPVIIPETQEPTLEEVMASKLAELDAFDTSPEVNLFFIGEMPMWLDRDTRVALRNRIDIEDILGKQTTTLWVGTMKLELPLQVARHIIVTLEGYAIEAFDVTASHRAAIMQLETIPEIKDYDFKVGYPQKVTFNL